MPLTLIGCGIAYDLTLKGIEAIRSADAGEVYYETYTNPIPSEKEKISQLEQLTGKKFVKLVREHLESSYLVEKAKVRNARVALLVSGDPLTATTHTTLVIECRQKNIPVEIIHNSSIYATAPGKAGLQIYRFGKTATLVNPRENYKPISTFEIIRQNLERNLHTLVLLDTEPQPMEAIDALKMLKEAGFKLELAVILSRLGWKDEKIKFGQIDSLIGKSLIDKSTIETDFGHSPFTIIIPAKLHMVEEEFLNFLA